MEISEIENFLKCGSTVYFSYEGKYFSIHQYLTEEEGVTSVIIKQDGKEPIILHNINEMQDLKIDGLSLMGMINTATDTCIE